MLFAQRRATSYPLKGVCLYPPLICLPRHNSDSNGYSPAPCLSFNPDIVDSCPMRHFVVTKMVSGWGGDSKSLKNMTQGG